MSASPAPKRSLAIKHADGEPLTRADIHYDLLYCIFSDPHKVFTDPYEPNSNVKLTFRELYIKALLHSDNLSKVARGHMTKSQLFAEDFAMLTLLVNMGRVNTTMSFFPEKRTSVRTYHPIPALQRTQNSLQDVPRIRHLLKASVLPIDKEGPPLKTPSDILSRAVNHTPATSVTNLVTILCNYSSSIGQAYLPTGVEFTDLFTRKDFSSPSRAQVFLWLCYHYLESPSNANQAGGVRNPFSGTEYEDRLPPLIPLSEENISLENVDTAEELQRCREALAKRSTHVAAKSGRLAAMPPTWFGDDEELKANSDEVKSKARRAPEGTKYVSNSLEKRAAADGLRHDLLKTRAERGQHVLSIEESPQDQISYVAVQTQNQRGSRSSPYPISTNTQPRYNRSERPKRSFVEAAFHDALFKHPLEDEDDVDFLEARLLILKRLRGEYPEYNRAIEPFIQDYDDALYLGQS